MAMNNGLEQLDEKTNATSFDVEFWKSEHTDALKMFADGTTVIIDCTTGGYVTGSTWHLARDAFEARFGRNQRFSHSFTIGRPIYVGGGIWQK